MFERPQICFMGLDQELFLFIQGFTGNALMDSTMLFLAEVLVLLVPITLVYLWFESRESRSDSVFVFAATVSGIAITYVLGLFYFHHQPFSVYETIISGGELDNAFPSQHTATMFSVFWSFLYLKRNRLAALFGVTGVLTGLARVFVGLHYPVDILGAVVAGLLGLSAIAPLDQKLDVFDPLVDLSYRVEEYLREKTGF